MAAASLKRFVRVATVTLLALLAPAAAQNGTNPSVRVEVATPAQFKEALLKEVAHIVITEHMDLSVFTNRTRSDEFDTIQYISTSNKLLSAATQSITVRTPICACCACLHCHACCWACTCRHIADQALAALRPKKMCATSLGPCCGIAAEESIETAGQLQDANQ
jgi:hypothetical protein